MNRIRPSNIFPGTITMTIFYKINTYPLEVIMIQADNGYIIWSANNIKSVTTIKSIGYVVNNVKSARNI